MVSRRDVLASAAAVAASVLFGCATGPGGRRVFGTRPTPGSRLRARPLPEVTQEAPLGLQPLGDDSLLFVPAGYAPSAPSPLVVLLHGAGGSAENGMSLLLDRADAAGLLLLAPSSRGRTWDVLLGGYGPDVAVLDRAMEQTFARYAVDPARIAVGGFSDGASYALGLGLANGDLLGKVVAFSPGFVPASPAEGRPEVFISHGTADGVLPIDRCSRRIVPALESRGYDVTYHEFEGGHEIPATIVDAALDWLAAGQ